MFFKKKLNYINKVKIWKIKNLFFYWFVKLKRLNFEKNLILNKMSIFKIFKILLNETTSTNIFYLKWLIYNWTFQKFHNKLTYLQYFRCFFFLSKKLFPFSWKRKIFWSLMRLRNNGRMRRKISQLRFFFLKDFVIDKWKKYNKKIYYFLTKQSYYSKLNLSHFDTFTIKWRLFNRLNRNFYMLDKHMKKLKLKSKFLLKKKNIIIPNSVKNKNFFFKRILSKSISFWFSKLFLNIWFFKKLKKLKKFFNFIPVKKDSFRRIFWFENLYAFENLLFWKSIINMSENIFSFLSEKPITPFKLNNLLNFFKTWNSLYEYNMFDGDLSTKVKNFSFIQDKQGLSSIWLFFFEQLLNTFQNFFIFNNSFLIKSIIYRYKDTFQQQSVFLPKSLKLKLDEIIGWLYKNEKIYNNETNSLNFILNLKIFDKLFYFFFRFSIAKMLILQTKNWNLISHCYEKFPLYPRKNWSFLNFYSPSYIKKMNKKNNLVKSNIYLNKKYYYDNFFFFKSFSKIFIWKWKIIKTIYNSTKYVSIHRYPTPVFFLKSFTLWWFFYMKSYVRLRWSKFWWNRGDEKISYDVLSVLKTNFWSNFYFFKSPTDKLLTYAYFFKNGLNSLNLSWNFSVNYFGKIKFTTFPNKLIFVGKKRFDWDRKLDDAFAEYRRNDLFFSFFSFLSRTYLLNYMLQFGHTKSSYNTTYKNFLIMIYNKRFIVNLLTIQVNLKWNLRILFKMFYLGGSICLVSSFNLLIEGLVSLYGAYSKQPYTRYLWVNGLVSNFDWIFKSIKVKLAKAYSGKVFFSKKSVRRLLRLWFCSKGILNNLSIDISFFPSVWTSYWIFLENCARFYPTISVNNTAAFVNPTLLDYYIVSNDYSLLSLSFYINLLIVSFKKAKLMWKLEFSVYPQKLISEFVKYQYLPIKSVLKLGEFKRQLWKIYSFFRNPKFLFLDFTRNDLSVFFKYYFISRSKFLLENKKQVYWRYLFYFNLKNKVHFIK